MITLTVKDITGETVLLEKQLSHISIQDGQIACFLSEIEYTAIPLIRNSLYRVTLTQGETVTLGNQICEYMTRQFNISAYVDDADGLTKEGVTNNNLIFRLFG